MAFNTDAEGRLTAFNGRGCKSVTIDGTEYSLADAPVNITFGPASGDAAHYRVRVDGAAKVCIPMPAGARKVTVKSGKTTIKDAALVDGNLVMDSSSISGRWLDVTIK